MTELVKVMDKPYQCVVTAVQFDVPGDYGDQHKVTIECDGEEYQWYVKTSSFDRIFLQDIQIGGTYSIVKNSPKGKSQYPFFTATLVSPGTSAAPSSSHSPSTPDPTAEESAKAKDEREMKAGIKDREIILQSVLKTITKPSIADMEEIKAATKELSRWVKKEAYRWYVEDKMEVVMNNEEDVGANE